MHSLLTWSQEYLKHKDIISRNILSFSEHSDGYVVQLKNNMKDLVIISDELKDLPNIDGFRKVYIFSADTSKNNDNLLSFWEHYASHDNVLIIFVNLKEQKKWMINPCVHQKICGSDLKKSILTLASNA